MQEFIDYVEKQDYPRAIDWCHIHKEDYEEYSIERHFIDIAISFDDLCYAFLHSVWEYDECNRLMKETLNFLNNIMTGE